MPAVNGIDVSISVMNCVGKILSIYNSWLFEEEKTHNLALNGCKHVLRFLIGFTYQSKWVESYDYCTTLTHLIFH